MNLSNIQMTKMGNILIIFVFVMENVIIVRHINVLIINQIWVAQNGVLCCFPSDALAHCNSDSNCGGYTMTTAEWFHKKYDKNGQVAVHLSKHGEKSIPCLLTEWSSYEKQNQTRRSPVLYGKSTCENTNEDKCYNSENFNYEFVSKSNVVEKSSSYLCSNHRNRFDNNKDMNCILSIVDAVSHCNSDNQCEGFMINTDENWQKKYLNNGMQVVQLFGKDTM
ncbi:unnamed protein product [Rotaria socialis]|uniref:Uncharacterized protein n=1 Tax=Rotaria socialis TaxID=392032 RepID=A0A817KF60_9BILA|nr:unnamed protein product [Rotaria socialis]